MEVAWQPQVFMKTYISGLIKQTLPKMLHFFVFPSERALSLKLLKYRKFIHLPFILIHSSTHCLWESAGNILQICLVVTFYINYTFLSRLPSVLAQVTPFSTEMILPKLQLLPFFIFPVWPPHLPMRSLQS